MGPFLLPIAHYVYLSRPPDISDLVAVHAGQEGELANNLGAQGKFHLHQTTWKD